MARQKRNHLRRERQRGGAGAARTLTKLGFHQSLQFGGGVLNAWVKDNLPLTKTTSGGKASAK